MLGDWQALLEDMAANPNQPVSKLPLSPSSERPDMARRPQAGSDPEDRLGSPRSPVEQVLAEAWTQVLGVERVSVYDNFFDLGGHSLAAVQVIDRLEKKLGVRLQLRELIFQTLGQLAADCEQRLQRMNRCEP
jgi:acyl carrier protein